MTGSNSSPSLSESSPISFGCSPPHPSILNLVRVCAISTLQKEQQVTGAFFAWCPSDFLSLLKIHSASVFSASSDEDSLSIFPKNLHFTAHSLLDKQR